MNEINILNQSRVREYGENIDTEISQFEKSSKIILPPLYKLFLNTYDLNSDFSPFPLKRVNPKFNNVIPIIRAIRYDFLENQLPHYEYFMSLAESHQAMNNYTEIKRYEIPTIPIIKFSNEVLITLGYENENMDKIYLIDLDRPEEKEFTFITENIFKLLKGFKIYDDEHSKKTLDKLSISWSDEYWKVEQQKKD